MFKDHQSPRCFALEPGTDFSNALIDGLFARLADHPLEAISDVEIFVNTRRTERRLSALLERRSPGFLPRIHVITDIARRPIPGVPFAPLVSPLRRRLELARVVTALLDKSPDLAPRTAAFDLADSLANLMDEMQSEGVSPEVFSQLEITADHAAHWQKSRMFLEILQPYFSDTSNPDKESRQRRAIEGLVAHWKAVPPSHPVLVAGSTGSRAPTALLMEAVAHLPNGAVILPGYDFGTPDALVESGLPEDHPQARVAGFVRRLGRDPKSIERWHDTEPPSRARNALVSLALRPAPVTDQWLLEGPALSDLAGASENMTLIEAPDQRREALAIALRLRRAAEDRQTATLISPDRQLTRQVSAILQRWSIEPDDSAGRPLHLSPTGIFLGLVLRCLVEPLTSERMLELLKHPLCNANPETRGRHHGHIRRLELDLVRGQSPFPDFEIYSAWASSDKTPEDCPAWIDWLRDLDRTPTLEPLPLSDCVDAHRNLAEKLNAGPQAGSTGSLWEGDAGSSAAKILADLAGNSDACAPLSAVEYLALFRAVLTKEEVVRRAETPHPDITIWGTIEARVGGADLVILGGLNDGTWPNLPAPDPWLNRQMRLQTGLLSPERRIGLSAHDFQQAIAAKEVVLTRSLRDSDAPTVASRWITRLTNLLDGLPETGAPALQAMRQRGATWLALADRIEQPAGRVAPANRPAPAPPAHARPARLSVTQIKTLVLDPFEIYARNVLGLFPLDPIRVAPDAMLRGRALHKVLETFMKTTMTGGGLTVPTMMKITEDVLQAEVPWPATRRMWSAGVARFAHDFVETEPLRQQTARPVMLEKKGVVPIGRTGVDLSGIADRIDQTDDGALVLYDYKSGAGPKATDLLRFDKQLVFLAHMASCGAFTEGSVQDVAGAAFIGLTNPLKVTQALVSPEDIAETWEGLITLINLYLDPSTSFPALYRHHEEPTFANYLHLSRFGEWTFADPPVVEVLT